MESIILQGLESWKLLAYAIIFLGIALEGEVIIFTAAFLVYDGFLDFYDTLFFAISGIIIGDIMWYLAGPHLKKIKSLGNIINKLSGPLDTQIKNKPAFSIIISKFTYGFHRLALLRAQESGVNFKKFLKIDVVGSIIWLIIIGGAGLVFSSSVILLKKYIKFAELGLLAGIIIFILLFHVSSKFIKKFFTIPARTKNISPNQID